MTPNGFETVPRPSFIKLTAPDWMNAGKISQFYDDPLKQSCDPEALRVAAYRRAVTMETGVGWKIHRRRVALQNQLRLLAQWKGKP